jgi:Lipopolysaccharide export system permease LptF/LptG
VYYVGLIGGEALGNRLYLPPALAMWSTDILFGVIGVVGLWRTGMVTASGRGGDGWLRPFRRRAPSAAT